MLHKHHRAVARLAADRDLKYLIRDYFDLPKSTALMPALLARSLGQADLVLCLLRLRDNHGHVRLAVESHVAALVGHPIVVGPSCLLRYRDNGRPRAVLDRTPRITWMMSSNPRQPNTDAYLRWSEYRLGRSVAQLKVRGVTSRDVRRAVRRGWIRLEEIA